MILWVEQKISAVEQSRGEIEAFESQENTQDIDEHVSVYQNIYSLLFHVFPNVIFLNSSVHLESLLLSCI